MFNRSRVLLLAFLPTPWIGAAGIGSGVPQERQHESLTLGQTKNLLIQPSDAQPIWLQIQPNGRNQEPILLTASVEAGGLQLLAAVEPDPRRATLWASASDGFVHQGLEPSTRPQWLGVRVLESAGACEVRIRLMKAAEADEWDRERTLHQARRAQRSASDALARPASATDVEAQRGTLRLLIQALHSSYQVKDGAGMLAAAEPMIPLADALANEGAGIYARVMGAWAAAELNQHAMAEKWLADGATFAAAMASPPNPALRTQMENVRFRVAMAREDLEVAENAIRAMERLHRDSHTLPPDGMSLLWAQLGERCWQRFETPAAQLHFMRALAVLPLNADPLLRQQLRRYQALTAQELGDYAQALPVLEELELVGADLPAAERVAAAIQLASLQHEIGLDEESCLGLRRAVDLAHASDCADLEFQARLLLAEILSQLGQAEEAAAILQEAPTDAESGGMYRARAQLAQVELRLATQRPAEALELARTALREWTPEEPAAWSVPLLAAAAEAALQLGNLPAAAESLARAETILDAPEVQALGVSAAFHLARYHRVAHLFQDLTLKRVAATRDASAREIEVAQGWRWSTLWKGRSVPGGDALLGTGGASHLESLRRIFGREDRRLVVLDLTRSGERLLAYRYWQGRAELLDLGAADELERVADDYANGISGLLGAPREPETVALGARLGTALLRDVVPAEAATILVIPYGPFARLPFDALVVSTPSASTANFDAVEFAVQRWAVLHAPALHLWRPESDPNAAASATLVVASPEFSDARYSALPATLDEARSIADLDPRATILAGAGATKEAFLARAQDASWLHLATHSVLDPAMPALSRIGMAGAEGADLTLREVSDMKLRAQLTVLSACDTARGRDLPGVGPQSFAAAFHGAGSRAVVATAWPVEDGAAAALMADFSRRVLEEGRSSAEALRAAKLQVLAQATGGAGEEIARTEVRSSTVLRGGAGLGRGRAPMSPRHPNRWASFLHSGAPVTVTRSAPGPAPQQATSRWVTVRWPDGSGVAVGQQSELIPPAWATAEWLQLEAAATGSTGRLLARSTFSLDPGRITNMSKAAQEMDPAYVAPDFSAFVEVRLADRQTAIRFVEEVQERFGPRGVRAYLSAVGGSPSLAGSNPHAKYQTYREAHDWTEPPDLTDPLLEADVGGVNAVSVASEAGADGTGIRFLDLEQDWDLAHEDLKDAVSGLTPIYGERAGSADEILHGTSTLGIVLAQDNDLGILGLAPAVESPQVASYLVTDASGEIGMKIADAIMHATAELKQFGAVMLLEIEVYGESETEKWPVEVMEDCYEAIRLASALGVIVVEAAGNGGISLDAMDDTFARKVMTLDEYDSGAILVGGCQNYSPNLFHWHAKSNYGSRVNAFAHAEAVYTTTPSTTAAGGTPYSDGFSGTSSASAIIAGAVCSIQGMALAGRGAPLSPRQMRAVLAYGANTLSGDATAYPIGRMPDLGALRDAGLFSAADDLFLRDDVTDEGEEVSTVLWSSPDILPMAGGTTTGGTAGTVAPGGSLEVDLQVGNRGAGDADSGTARLYYAPASTLITPDDWISAGDLVTGAVSAGGTTLVGPLSVPVGFKDERFCYLGSVRGSWDEEFTPTSFTEIEDLQEAVKRFNNLALKAAWVDVYEFGVRSTLLMSYRVSGAREAALLTCATRADLPAGSKLRVRVPTEFVQLLPEAERARFKAEGEVWSMMLKPSGVTEWAAVEFPPDAHFQVNLIVEIPESAGPGPYVVEASQLQGGRMLGRLQWSLIRRPSPEAGSDQNR